MKIAIIGTANHKSRVSNRIRKITKGGASHVLARFTAGDEDVYYESHWGKDEETGKSGVRGPLPITKLNDWKSKDPDNRFIYETGYMDMPESAVQNARVMADWCVDNVRYSKTQIFQNWMAHRTGVYMGKRKGGPGRMTCSEFVSTLIPTCMLATEIKIGYITYDMIVPSSHTYATGILEAVARMNKSAVWSTDSL